MPSSKLLGASTTYNDSPKGPPNKLLGASTTYNDASDSSPPVSPTSTKVRNEDRRYDYAHEHQREQTDESSAQDQQQTQLQSKFARYRSSFRAPMAEFFGTAVLCIFGCAGGAQATLSSNGRVTPSLHGDWSSVALGWGLGLGLGAWVSGGISGGHINPAVTLALATWRRFPWRKVPAYIFAQVMGGIFGAALVYANYYHAINIFDGGSGVRTLDTAGFFGTFALDYVPNSAAFFYEYTGTLLLMLVVLVCTDTHNGPPPAGLLPVALFLVLFGIGICFGMQTGFAVNPARDFGPRVLTAIAGWGSQVFSYRRQYWLWCPIIAPILGAQTAALLYDVFIYEGDDSVIHRFLFGRKKQQPGQVAPSKYSNEGSNGSAV